MQSNSLRILLEMHKTIYMRPTNNLSTEAVRNSQCVLLIQFCDKSFATLECSFIATCSWCSYTCCIASHLCKDMQVSFSLLKVCKL